MLGKAKLIQYWDVQQSRKENFDKFLTSDFIPRIDETGLMKMTGFWQVASGEDPYFIAGSIKQFINKGTTFNLEVEREKLVQERKEAEQEVLGKIPFDQREWFRHLMQLAQKSGVFSEEHDHYLDLYTHALIRRSVLGLGKCFAKAGTIKHPDDIFFLTPDEVRKAGLVPDQFDVLP